MITYIGLAIVLLTIYLLVKQKESRMVLFCSGLLMAVIAGDPMVASKDFPMGLLSPRCSKPLFRSWDLRRFLRRRNVISI